MSFTKLKIFQSLSLQKYFPAIPPLLFEFPCIHVRPFGIFSQSHMILSLISGKLFSLFFILRLFPLIYFYIHILLLFISRKFFYFKFFIFQFYIFYFFMSSIRFFYSGLVSSYLLWCIFLHIRKCGLIAALKTLVHNPSIWVTSRWSSLICFSPNNASHFPVSLQVDQFWTVFWTL